MCCAITTHPLFAWHKRFGICEHWRCMWCTMLRVNAWIRSEECRPVGFQSPPCVSVVPPAASRRTPASVSLTAPAAPQCWPPVKSPPVQFTAQQKLGLCKADYSILTPEKKMPLACFCTAVRWSVIESAASKLYSIYWLSNPVTWAKWSLIFFPYFLICTLSIYFSDSFELLLPTL